MPVQLISSMLDRAEPFWLAFGRLPDADPLFIKPEFAAPQGEIGERRFARDTAHGHIDRSHPD